MGVTLGGKSCLEPLTLYTFCQEHGLPVSEWYAKANSYVCPLGSKPGTGYLLMRRGDLALSVVETSDSNATLNLNASHDLVWTVTDAFQGEGTFEKQTVTLKNLVISRATAVCPGLAEDAETHYLVEVADRRQTIRRVMINAAYNVRSATTPTTSYTATQNGGVNWTWDLMGANLWNTQVGSALLGTWPGLPFTPDGTPDSFIYYQMSALDALQNFLARVGCSLRYNPVADTFSIVRLGIVDAVFDTAETKWNAQRVWDSYNLDLNRALTPQYCRVAFHKFTQPADASPWYVVNVADATAPIAPVADIVTGTYVIVPDDLWAVYDAAGTQTAASVTATGTRATERAADYFRILKLGKDDLVRVYAGAIGEAGFLPGAQILGTAWEDRGLGAKTTLYRGFIPASLGLYDTGCCDYGLGSRGQDGGGGRTGSEQQASALSDLPGIPYAWLGRSTPGGVSDAGTGSVPTIYIDLATAAALPANTLSGSGTALILTGNANGALVVDGITVTAGQIILVKNEATVANNRYYSVTTVGTAGTAYVLTEIDYSSVIGRTNLPAGTIGYVGPLGNTNAKKLFTNPDAQTRGTVGDPRNVQTGGEDVVISTIATPIILDDFNDTHGTGLQDHVLDVPATTLWVVQVALMGIDTATGSQAKVTMSDIAGRAVSTVETSNANVQVTCKHTMGSGNGGFGGIVLRYLDVSNYWYVGLSRDADTLTISEVKNGSTIIKETVAFTVDVDVQYTLEVTAAGPIISARVISPTIITALSHASATFQQTLTKHGLIGIGPGNLALAIRFDDFRVIAASAANTLLMASGTGNRTLVAGPIPTRGAVLVGNSSAVWSTLAVGVTTRFLQSDGTDTTFVAFSSDITVAAGGAATIASNAVTTAKILDANVTFAKLLDATAISVLIGRGAAAGAGDFQEVTLGANLTMTGTVLAAVGGAGDALVANPLSQFAATTSAQLAGVISNETGTGLLVFNHACFLTFPALTNPELTTTGSGGFIVIATSDDNSVEIARLYGDRATPAANDEGFVSLYLSNSIGTQKEFGRLTWVGTDVTNATEDGRLDIGIVTAGTMADELSLDATNLFPSTTDDLALGNLNNKWSDLHLAVGAVINWGASDVLCTHSSNTIAWSGGTSYTWDATLTVYGGVTATTAISGTTVAGAMVATQAEMETATATDKLVPPGRQHNHPGNAKFWAYITVSGGVPTLASSYNMTSITDTAVGSVTLTIATDFSSANWSTYFSVNATGTTADEHRYTSKAAGSIVLNNTQVGTGNVDPTSYDAGGFGDQ